MKLYYSVLAVVITFGLIVPAIAWADVYCAVCIVNGGEKGDRGPRGPRGYTGATGETGPQGEAGLAGADGRDGKDALNDDDYWTDDDLGEMFAASMAISGIDFTNTTEALQIGVGVGGWGDDVEAAIGVGYLADIDATGDILFSFKTTVEEVGPSGDEHRAWVGAAVWKVRIE